MAQKADLSSADDSADMTRLTASHTAPAAFNAASHEPLETTVSTSIRPAPWLHHRRNSAKYSGVWFFRICSSVAGCQVGFAQFCVQPDRSSI